MNRGYGKSEKSFSELKKHQIVIPEIRQGNLIDRIKEANKWEC